MPDLTDEQILQASRKLILDRFVGTLTTIDAQDQPHSRYMGAMPSDDGLTRLYSIAARNGRKLDHLLTHHKVCWLYADPRYDEVVKVLGVMRVVDAQSLGEPIWQHLEEATWEYSMTALSDPENLWFVGLETIVEAVEYMKPKDEITRPLTVQVASAT